MRPTELSIIPECYVDTKIAEIVGQASNKYNHQHSCGDVAKEMQKLKDRVCLGIIDEDKNKGPKAKYFSEFGVLKEENNLILQKHRQRKQFLILICPEIERWLMNDAKAVKINPADENYKLPVDLKSFTSMCKTKDIDRNEGFYRFVKTLIKEKAPSITTLKKWMELFRNDQLEALINN